MLRRSLEAECATALREYPIVTLLGPRQAGKTTLARSFADFAYCNLEQPDLREFAERDPKALLAQYPGKVIFDEIQRVPSLLSYLQVAVDAQPGNGRYILTGSHQLSLREGIAQSLAGRTAVLYLLPFSISELSAGGIAFPRFEDYLHTGFLPRVHHEQLRPTQAYSNYYQTYVERDVRQLIHLRDASLFEKFMRLLAGRTGQLVDLQSLGNDVGVDSKTIRNWLSILEASFIVFKVAPYFDNFGKRVIKSAKYYFVEVGLLVYLLGIERADQITRDPLVGAMFENLVIADCLKQRYSQGRNSPLYFYRDSNGNEVDLLLEQAGQLTAVEIKAASTFSDTFLKPGRKLAQQAARITSNCVIYNGDERQFSDGSRALRFDQVSTLLQPLA